MKGGGVDRLTNAKKHTGLHKDQFDPRSDREKGRDDRYPVTQGTGYVTNYKLAGSYDRTQ